MAPTYFVSVAAIVAAFYGKEAFVSRTAVIPPAPTLKKIAVPATPQPAL